MMFNMLKLNQNKVTETVGVALRVSARSPFGAKPYHKLPPSSVVNRHWEIANKEGLAVFSTNVILDTKRWGKIDKLILFANSQSEIFLCVCDIVEILAKDNEWKPNIDEKFLVPEWKDEEKRTWIMVKNFKQLDIDTCEYQLLNKDILLREQILKPRFRSCYVKL